ncbi:MAG: DNA mismatch repair protein MutS [Candidatus Eisenbacteria bacterium]|uniref:DNA mismatch repair protein MutS n=1 Tax=Eiseniibacteriota bacterium TaxID=2212470 RepID=A0A7Y2H2J8_UNCEI|nr:DNA mismatch repair protein MutS [Candidatus Eisenbacteria bacterium]
MGKTTDNRSTPMMRQYLGLKEKHTDAILFFRMGDFYEMFFDDAEVAADVLGLTLTSRDKGKANPIPMAGVPWHAAEGYIAKLVARGHRVAVCEQMTDPSESKGIVEREVVEVVTPGTAFHESITPDTEHNFVAALLPGKEHLGFAAADITTGTFFIEDLPGQGASDYLYGIRVGEWLLPDDVETLPAILQEIGKTPLKRPAWWFDRDQGERELLEQFHVPSLSVFDAESMGPALGAAVGLLHYLREVRGKSLPNLVRLQRLRSVPHMVLDETTRRNLELVRPLGDGGKSTTLLGVLDRTVTSLGARCLRQWLLKPLLDPKPIEARYEALDELIRETTRREGLKSCLRNFRDLERLLGRMSFGKASPRDLLALGSGAAESRGLAQLLSEFQSSALHELGGRTPDLTALGETITGALVPEPPLNLADGGVFKDGWNAELDELRKLSRGGKTWIASLQEKEREATGIPTLKVGYNKVFGYYLEVTKAHQERVPESYIRKQTLVNAERYVTQELKEEENRILGADEKLRQMERRLFAELREKVLAQAANVQGLADVVGETDSLRSLADVAHAHRYCRPELVSIPTLDADEARHPVVERLLDAGEFIPNEIRLNGEERQVAVITGPNMAGKSTYLRQTGLLTIMAQMGSFVPADRFRFSPVDRVFTRVGASDSIAKGQSTFMVEMQEASTILHGATNRSLVLLDEVGRGTSTYDGLSIAWSVTEYLHERSEGRPLTLFATHYHELTSLSENFPRVFNLNVEVKEWNGKVIFLRKIVEGAADQSYGIYVAALAGLPQPVLQRAREILADLETGLFRPAKVKPETSQLTLFEPEVHQLEEELKEIDPNQMTPMEALTLLLEWKKRYEK